MNKENTAPWFIFLLVPAMFAIVVFRDWLSANGLMLPAVIAFFAAAFGFFLILGLKEWKKSDEEVLSAYDIFKSFQPKEGTGTKKTVLRALLGSAAFISLLLQESSIMPKAAKIVVSILALVVTLVPILSIIRAKFRKTSRTYRITHVEVTAFLVGLIPSLFICFVLGISIYYGVWWFAALPCLVFLVCLTRPLVAAVRTVYKRCRPDDEVHLRKGKELDPWERPDTDLKKYRRK